MKIFILSRQTRLGPAWILLNILLGLLLLHLTSLPIFAAICLPGQCTTIYGGCGVDTAIGCLPVNLEDVGAFLFGIAVEILGLLALIMFAIGGYQTMIAGDNPDVLQEGKAKMTAAITGFFFLLLFVVIIRMIGIEILGITPLWDVI